MWLIWLPWKSNQNCRRRKRENRTRTVADTPVLEPGPEQRSLWVKNRRKRNSARTRNLLTFSLSPEADQTLFLTQELQQTYEDKLGKCYSFYAMYDEELFSKLWVKAYVVCHP